MGKAIVPVLFIVFWFGAISGMIWFSMSELKRGHANGRYSTLMIFPISRDRQPTIFALITWNLRIGVILLALMALAGTIGVLSAVWSSVQ